MKTNEITAAQALANAHAWYNKNFPVISLSDIFLGIEKESHEGRTTLRIEGRISPEDAITLKEKGYTVKLRKTARGHHRTENVEIYWWDVKYTNLKSAVYEKGGKV